MNIDSKIRVSSRSILIAECDSEVASFAEAAVVLFLWRLCESHGFEEGATYHARAMGFDPYLFVDMEFSRAADESFFADNNFVRTGSILMIVSELKDSLDCTDWRDGSAYRYLVDRIEDPDCPCGDDIKILLGSVEEYDERWYEKEFTRNFDKIFNKWVLPAMSPMISK